MKQILIGFAIFGIFTLTYSCKSGEKKGATGSAGSPTAAIKAMATEAKSGNFKSISASMCKADKEIMEKMMAMVEGMAANMGKDINEMMKEEMTKDGKFNFNDVTFSNEKINGDKATVDVYNKKENKTETINLAKENGVWKICMGIAEKANEEMRKNSDKDPNAPKSMNELMEKMKDPKVQEEMKKAQEMLKNMKPEDMEKMKEAMEKMKPN